MFPTKYQRFFSLNTVKDVVELFNVCLDDETTDPDLTLLSLVVGSVESVLTAGVNLADETSRIQDFPIVDLGPIQALYKKFQGLLSSVESNNKTRAAFATREIIKKVSDIIWNSLRQTNKKSDRAHLQSLYSFLTSNKLDCFGTAFAVVSACQLLGYKDVHLAISEDHVWVVFGKTGEETIEVTWHGKIAEDKRGQSVIPGIEQQIWKYVNGNAVICDRRLEVAAIVSSINPSLNATTACVELAELQQKLLWVLYDKNILQKYPMGLGCLGELEEVYPSPGRKSCEELYNESIASARKYYKNHHVYPYCYAGAYYLRQNNYKMALKSWADAGEVIRLYNYHRDDEEIYKEFLEIANESIPQIIKLESSGHHAHSIIRSAECFGYLLRFYDGICQWEEGSQTPILHIGWAKPLVNNISKFEFDIRSQLVIKCATESDEPGKAMDSNSKTPGLTDSCNNNILKAEEANSREDKDDKDKISSIVAACGEKILNAEFLLQGGGKLFTESDKKDDVRNEQKPKVIEKAQSSAEKVVQPDPPPPPPLPPKLSKEEEELLGRPVITLFSQKMKGLGLNGLLQAEKLNQNALSLQITALSQVSGKKSRFGAGSHAYAADYEMGTRPKRARRE